MDSVLWEVIVRMLGRGLSLVPIEWKRYIILPINNGNNKEGPMNYRPVSHISEACKLYKEVKSN